MAKGKKPKKIGNALYESELLRLQTELVTLQEWAKTTGARIVVIFEGRDAAGKGGTIKRITEYLSPRVARTAALPSPTERERGQWYYQRYIAHLPAPGEIVLFDRSWYNRAGVERVMGFCTPEEYDRFLVQTPIFEKMLIDDGILLRKYWFSVSDAEQLKRFRARLSDPVSQWKLSPMDLESINRWEDYSRAKDTMMAHTDTPFSPWYVVESDIKKHARLNMMAHLLSTIPYQEVPSPEVKAAAATDRQQQRIPAPAARAVDVRARPRGEADGGGGQGIVSVRFAQWTLDVHDVERMLAFWSAALGYEVDGDHLRPPADAEPGSPTVWLQRTAASKSGKLRGHVDLYVPAGGTLDREVSRLIGLGARRVDVGQTGDEGFEVLADPEGNEFCVLHQRWSR